MSFSNIQSWGVTFASILVVIFFAFSKIRESIDAGNKTLIANLKEEKEVYRTRAERLTEENRVLKDTHSREINELNKQIGILQGNIEQMAKQNEMYLNILKDRNPEQKEFMKLLTDSAIKTDKYMHETASALKEIHVFMKSLNTKAVTNEKRNDRVDNGPVHESIDNIEKMTKASEDRDMQIDDDTLKGKGKVLRREVVK